MSRLPQTLASTLMGGNMVLSGILLPLFSFIELAKWLIITPHLVHSAQIQLSLRVHQPHRHNLKREAHFSVSSAVLWANDSLCYLVFLSCSLHVSQLRCGITVDSFSPCFLFTQNNQQLCKSKFLFHNKSTMCLEEMVILAPGPALGCTVHMVWS